MNRKAINELANITKVNHCNQCSYRDDEVLCNWKTQCSRGINKWIHSEEKNDKSRKYTNI